MSAPEKLRALAASARIANIPSVVSNVVVGITLAVAAGADLSRSAGRLGLVIAGASLYLAGNFLNDWADRAWDASHRPERALPSGVFPPGLYLSLALAFGLLGLGLAAAVNGRCVTLAAMIGFLIVLYTAIHKHTAWSVIPMGLCRALLPALGFSGLTDIGKTEFAPIFFTAPVAVIACGFGLFCHIAGLSLSARYESGDPVSRGPALFAGCLFPLAALSMLVASMGKYLNVALLAYGVWIAFCLTVFRKPVSRQVSNLLAGIPLLDWIAVLPLAMSCGGWWSAGMLVWIPPLAFIACKLLQRLAPAT